MQIDVRCVEGVSIKLFWEIKEVLSRMLKANESDALTESIALISIQDRSFC